MSPKTTQIWLLQAKFEVDVMGFNRKNERTNKPRQLK